MKITVWTLSTCYPDGSTVVPCQPEVFATEHAAVAAFDKALRNEWETVSPGDEETGAPMPYPGDPDEAQSILVDRFVALADLDEPWGTYLLASHTLEIS